MSDSKFTKGPWWPFKSDEPTESFVISQGPEGRAPWIAVIPSGLGRDKMEANTRLISAAPDLLEALWAILYADQDNHIPDELHKQARVAIAKARGEADEAC